ncbi:restriction endonuclease subunit S [Anaerotruncus sp. 1XD42-93]|uniref:restriction endonuclease subunit S n=1 Tax=Anaerotruncus sp. 1XD42-93 TaxID=2320853 RepID=UPI000EA3C7B2|nr:restriction endonuclease subunit S [Anaerotruncus sp. 1XD42-93]NBK19064.1 restriction endonuclease subunit S [Anaerotruncus sp. 1XD42-93]RKJ82702.1 restriction endonuclease subunit S [Anaerotruncus sp. 1XD22-93]
MVNTERIPNGYHITEAGILPTEWQVKKLNEVVTELTERAGQDMYETVSISAGIGFVNQAEKFGKELSGKQYEKYIVLHKGDFSYNKGNSKTSPQGCIYRLNDRESAAVPNVFESFRIKEQDADYYEQLFLSGFLNRQLYSRINRGVRDDGLLNLTGKDFYSCMVPVPPIDEQKQIAKILAQCDKVIELKQQLIAEEEKKNQWLLEFVYKLSGVQHTKIPLKNCGKWFSGGTPDKRNNDYWDHGTIKWVSSQEVKETHIQDTTYKITHKAIAEYTTAIAPAYSLLLVTRSGILKHSIPVAYISEDMAINQDIKALIPKEGIDYYYLLSYLKYKEKELVSAYVKTGTTVESIIMNLFLKLEVPFPSYEEQIRISNVIRCNDKKLQALAEEVECWKEKKKALMQVLLTGTVRVKT